jgi:hypothetical protein
MREITSHQINECNEAIRISCDERDEKNGNASHHYVLEPQSNLEPSFAAVVLSFQHGPIKEVGTNGITHEALLAVLIDRLEGFQAGPYACEENAQALNALQVARSALKVRTRGRVARGVEGTHEV